jgi:hypothetical protein
VIRRNYKEGKQMNTYMVEVNNKFLVRLEIEGSACAAEHYFLDGFRCVWGAMAYDEKAMKTECFRGACLNDELIALDLLEERLREVDEAQNTVKAYDIQLRELDDQIAKLKSKRDDLLIERNNAKDHYDKQFSRCNCGAV